MATTQMTHSEPAANPTSDAPCLERVTVDGKPSSKSDSALLHGKAGDKLPRPRIDPPKPKSKIVLSVADFGAKPDDDGSDGQAFAAALDACKRRGAAALVLPKGRYRFQDLAMLGREGGHILLDGLSDMTIDGQGSELVFHHIRAGFQFRNCRRIVVKNLTVDWDIRLASAAVVDEEPGVGKVLRVLDEFPVTVDTPIGRMSAVSEYDLAARRWVIGGEECYYPEDVKQIRPQVFTSPSFAGFSVGKTFVVRHHVYSAHAFDFGGPGNADLAFEDITVFASPGHNFVGYGCERGFRLSRCRIARRDEPGRLISGASDGAHFGATRGDILVEDCDFAFMGDDSINIHGAWMRVAAKPSGRMLALTSRWFESARVSPGEELKLCHAANLEEYGRATVVAVETDNKAKILRVTVDRDLPAEAEKDDYVANLARSSPTFVIRNNTFHDHRARGMLIQARGGLIEGNRISRVMAAALQMTTDANYWQEGFGCEDIIVRNNVFEGCNYAGWERGARGRHMACINLIVDTTKGLGEYPVHRNIVIEGNTITDTPGLAVLVASSRGVVIRNNRITDSNTRPFGDAGSAVDAPAQGAIMVTRAADVTVAGNRFSGKTIPAPAVFIDRRNTREVVERE